MKDNLLYKNRRYTHTFQDCVLPKLSSAWVLLVEYQGEAITGKSMQELLVTQELLVIGSNLKLCRVCYELFLSPPLILTTSNSTYFRYLLLLNGPHISFAGNSVAEWITYVLCRQQCC